MNSVIISPHIQMLTLDQVAQRLVITKRTLYREIAAKRFPAPVKIRGSSRVLESDYAAYVAALVSKRAV